MNDHAEVSVVYYLSIKFEIKSKGKFRFGGGRVDFLHFKYKEKRFFPRD